MCKEIRPLQDIIDSLIKESEEEIHKLEEKVKGLRYE